jgi:uncharacterized protein
MTVSKTWRKHKEHYLLAGARCNECKELIFPSREVCRRCSSTNLSEHIFRPFGEIITFTVIRTQINDPEGENIDIPARNIPYVLAIIKLDEGPRLTAQVVECSAEELKIGRKVEMVFRKLNEKGDRGIIEYGYKFRITD